MIVVNSVFAAYELALASVHLARLEQLAAENKPGAVAAVHMKRNVEGSLAGIQLGITLFGAVAAATGGAGAEERIAPAIEHATGLSAGIAEVLAIAAIVAPLTVFTILFGELVPKVFALRNKEWVCLAVSPAMKFFVTLVWPIVWLLEKSVSSLMAWGERRFAHDGGKGEAAELLELKATAAQARFTHLIGDRQERIIVGATSLTTRPVGEIMLPADAISLLHADAHVADALVAAHLDMHTRFPVSEVPGDPQKVIGYVNFKDIIAHMRLAARDGSTVRTILRDIPSFPLDAPVVACLEQMIRGYVHIALVRNANGVVVGMITLEDIIEELVGDIGDEYDHLPVHISRSGRGWVVGGGISPDRLKQLTEIELPVAEADTAPRHLSEWVSRQFTEPLRGGEVVTRGPLRVVVRKVRRQNVLEAQVTEDVPT
ncbi:MAG: hemolysin family protein [Fimbriiglobus sp.]|nr:hemolysin family protein [Fimbriiglobus sp.]